MSKRTVHTSALQSAAANDQRSANSLAAYLNGLSRRDLLTPAQEVKLARDIERREVDAWAAVLSFRPLLSTVLPWIAEAIGDGAPSFGWLERADSLARQRKTAEAREAYARRGRTVAAKLRALDRDRMALDALVPRIESLVAGRRDAGSRAWVRRIGEQLRAAAALREQFIECNLRLVVTVARKFAHGSLPLSDLIQEGNIGLIKAVNRFDYRRGFRFSTYACWWIRHHVGRAVADKSRTVRRPVHVIDTAQKVGRTRYDLWQQLGREPTIEELAESLDVSVDKIRNTWLRVYGADVSLDEPVFDDASVTRLEMTAAPDDESPLEEVDRKAREDGLRRALATLSPQDAQVLRRRFGFEGGREWTLQEIANDYGLSRERIRQIEVRAMDRLRRVLAKRRQRRAAG